MVLEPLSYNKHPPALIYHKFYCDQTKIKNLRVGEIIELHSRQLKSADSKFYFFEQYQYMKD
jgi:hypothetical protein